jgi:hypothetical protein
MTDYEMHENDDPYDDNICEGMRYCGDDDCEECVLICGCDYCELLNDIEAADNNTDVLPRCDRCNSPAIFTCSMNRQQLCNDCLDTELNQPNKGFQSLAVSLDSEDPEAFEKATHMFLDHLERLESGEQEHKSGPSDFKSGPSDFKSGLGDVLVDMFDKCMRIVNK